MSNILIRIIISVLAVFAMIVHLTKWRDVQFSWEALALLLIAALPWLPAFVESFKLGKDSLEVKLREVEKKADAAIDASLRGTVKNPTAASVNAEELKIINNADRQKGLWGGSPSNNSRLLSAFIEKIPGEDYFRRVVLQVESTNAAKPLSGKVTFHLHQTFNTPDFDVPVVNGVAETSLVSYGVFTVGAEADNGATKLELDLASLNDGKDQFFNR